VANPSSSVVPDINNNRVYYLTTPNSWQIEAFDATTASSTGILAIGDDADSAGNLVRWGSDGLAFSTSNKKVYFRQTFDLH
jgi:hypothetical protein